MQISPALLDSPQRLGQRFAQARPFRHLILDGFFRQDFAANLLQEFPAFEQGNARTENGDLGQKSTVEKIRELGASFEALDNLVKSKPFLDWLSKATEIPDLLYDPYYFGGGTHESREGQELDAHVDFNRHPANGWHRRLNLIVYLNPEWSDSWGGSLELHSDPRRDDNQVTLVTPLFNRCVVFETTEWSWHGFGRITLPPERADTSRRSIALYFYSKTRPADELAPEHSTIYVERPLPERFQSGFTLGEPDVQELRILLARRDQHIQRLYRDLMRQQDELAAVSDRASWGRAVWLAGCSTVRFLFSPASGERRQELKLGLLPLARRLPAVLREPGRRLWRRLG